MVLTCCPRTFTLNPLHSVWLTSFVVSLCRNGYDIPACQCGAGAQKMSLNVQQSQEVKMKLWGFPGRWGYIWSPLPPFLAPPCGFPAHGAVSVPGQASCRWVRGPS